MGRLEALGLKVSTAALRPAIQLIAPPVYGELNPKFTDFIAPGMIIAIAFAQSIGLTAMAIVMARLEGTLDRQVNTRGFTCAFYLDGTHSNTVFSFLNSIEIMI